MQNFHYFYIGKIIILHCHDTLGKPVPKRPETACFRGKESFYISIFVEYYD